MYTQKKGGYTLWLFWAILFNLGVGGELFTQERECSLPPLEAKERITSFLKKHKDRVIKISIFGDCGHTRRNMKTTEEDFMGGERPEGSIRYPTFYYWAGGYMLPYILITMLYAPLILLSHFFILPLLLYRGGCALLERLLYWDHLLIGIPVLLSKMLLPISILLLLYFSPFYIPSKWMDIGENEFYTCTIYRDKYETIHMNGCYSFYKKVTYTNLVGDTFFESKGEYYDDLNKISLLYTAPFFVGMMKNVLYNYGKIKMKQGKNTLSLKREDEAPIYSKKKHEIIGGDTTRTSVDPVEYLSLSLQIDKEGHLLFEGGDASFEVKLESIERNQIVLLLTPVDRIYKDIQYWRVTLSTTLE